MSTKTTTKTPALPEDAVEVTRVPSAKNNVFRWFFAVIAVVNAAMLLCQPFLAGMHIGGDSGALNLHYLNGQALMSIAGIQFIAALMWWRPGGGPAKAAVWSLILVGLVTTQFWIGYFQYPSMHLPLGIATLFCAILVAIIPFRRVQVKAA